MQIYEKVEVVFTFSKLAGVLSFWQKLGVITLIALAETFTMRDIKHNPK
jgi:hypothetical protein